MKNPIKQHLMNSKCPNCQEPLFFPTSYKIIQDLGKLVVTGEIIAKCLGADGFYITDRAAKSWAEIE